MTTDTFDPAAYKRTTLAQWETAADAWDRWGPAIEDWLGNATDVMLEAAGIITGSRVLDVAAGAGGQTLVAAERVGPSGHVLATDISPTILEYAARAADRAGLAQVHTLVADGESLVGVEPSSYDAVISRVGLIYFPDQSAALAGMCRALRPGGRLSAVVYSTADRNEFFSLPVEFFCLSATKFLFGKHRQLLRPVAFQNNIANSGLRLIAIVEQAKRSIIRGLKISFEY